jgi:hypothetical protein
MPVDMAVRLISDIRGAAPRLFSLLFATKISRNELADVTNVVW